MLWLYLKNKMLHNPKQIICESDAEMSYEEVIVFAEEFAKKLKGVKCCTILCRSEMMAAIALLSCFAANVTAVPLSHRYGDKHCAKILDVISPDAMIMDNNDELQVVYISDSDYTPPRRTPTLIMCTSGTTGTPKGVMLSENNIITNVTDIAKYFNISSNDAILIARPLYHCAVLTGEFITSLIKGAKVRFYSGEFNPAKVLTLIESHKITTFCGTPTLLNMMARFKSKYEVSSLKHICISGESLSRETGAMISKAFVGAEIYHVYGLTEACPRVTHLPPELFNKYSEYVGVPLDSVSIKITLPDGTVAKPNEIGTLWVKGENVMIGYYNSPHRTKEVLKNGWLNTGDLAMLNEKCLLKIIGRSDDMIIKAGMNIYPQEIENALKADPRIVDVLLCTEPSEHVGVQLVLKVVGDFKDIKEVKEVCHMYLPSYAMPSKIHIVSELPKNGSGKIIRRNSNDRM